MSLPSVWIEAIFTKLSLVYGQQFLRRWQDMNLNAVKADWAHELRGLEDAPKRVEYALQNLPVDHPPTVLEFRAIAYKAPVQENTLLELRAHKGAPMPANIRKEIERLRGKTFQQGAAA